jgi:hypothetical protein
MFRIAESARRKGSMMPDGLTYLLIFIALVIVYTIAKVVAYVRRSEQQWRDVDKSKLRVWDDEDD